MNSLTRVLVDEGATRRGRKGLDARELSLPPAQGKVFSLDIPFYKTRPKCRLAIIHRPLQVK